MEKNELYENLLTELDRSLVVDDKTRSYWLKNYKTLPKTAVELFYEQLKMTDTRVNVYIAAAIDADPSLSEEITQKGREARKKLLKFLETQSNQEENPEEFLKTHLK